MASLVPYEKTGELRFSNAEFPCQSMFLFYNVDLEWKRVERIGILKKIKHCLQIKHRVLFIMLLLDK